MDWGSFRAQPLEIEARCHNLVKHISLLPWQMTPNLNERILKLWKFNCPLGTRVDETNFFTVSGAGGFDLKRTFIFRLTVFLKDIRVMLKDIPRPAPPELIIVRSLPIIRLDRNLMAAFS